MIMVFMNFLLTLASATAVSSHAVDILQLETTIGSVYGIINSSTPHVAQYLGIPFAEPSLGDVRFKPPQQKSRGQAIFANKTGPSCPQHLLNKQNAPSVYTYDAPCLQPYGAIDEDCLTLNVWTPLKKSKEPLPVLIWVFGGGFYEGGLLTNGFDSSNWIQRTESHTVVALNYRNNIFAIGVEWVRDNIAAFGGDTLRMVMWGQSSGAASCDFYNYAYPDDPIVSGFILHPGNALDTGVNNDLTHTNFTFIAEYFGRVDLSRCLQKVHWKNIIDLYESYNLNHSTGQLKWTTVIDNIAKFENHTKRTLAGKYSANANEEASLITWPGPAGPNMTYIHIESLSVHICPAVHHTSLSYQGESLTLFYSNEANFSNISPRSWEGAYHTSELPLLFGTWEDYGGPGTSFEAAVSAHWQDLYLEFMKDPVHGLPRYGWPAYSPNGSATLMGEKGRVLQLMNITVLQDGCAGIPETYD
ncbi:chlorogenic acid esterase precursor [Penicillium malachiteum]|uniref:chlorogenic acid esterase precursor n=1 Tax=Penicillium malachiteum TaxID=1324776 RepID=UPI00254658E0|nr:chlorogenic acid esterase precursor [Penicillium malachiteum]KAJ5728538.1 chlorogenic acid esterase precursor [Penicillium malachiteum]